MIFGMEVDRRKARPANLKALPIKRDVLNMSKQRVGAPLTCPCTIRYTLAVCVVVLVHI